MRKDAQHANRPVSLRSQVIRKAVERQKIMKFTKIAIISGIILGFSANAYATSPNVMALSLVFLTYVTLMMATFILPLGLLRKVVAVLLYFVFNLIILEGRFFKFITVYNQELLLLAPVSTWSISIIIAFAFKKLHILDVPKEK